MAKPREFQKAVSSEVRRLNPHLFHDAPNHRSALPDAKPQRHKAPALDSATTRKAASLPRITVRFVGYRVRLLDPDNFAGSVKDLLDGLRHSGLVLGDEPWRIRLETEQEKVRSKKDEKTLIDISYPDGVQVPFFP